MNGAEKPINGNACPQCKMREISVKIRYANGVYVLCCNECAKVIQMQSQEIKKERVQ